VGKQKFYLPSRIFSIVTITVKTLLSHTKSWLIGFFSQWTLLAAGQGTAFLLVLLAFIDWLEDTEPVVGDVWLIISARINKCVE